MTTTQGGKMSAFSANPVAYIIPAVLVVGFGLYYLYGAIDRLGLPLQQADAVVTGKTFTPGGTTYNTNVVAGRAWTQANELPDNYAVSLLVDKEPTVALVTKQKYDALSANDRVRVKLRRTRLSGRLEVVELNK
jgi:hypothetical protein